MCLISYSMLDKMLPAALRKFRIVVADEAHNIKSRGSIMSMQAAPLLKAATVALCITGTPQPNRPEELYVMCNALCEKMFPSYDTFTARYCAAKVGSACVVMCPEDMRI